jgi:hypothetical protein
LLINHPSAFGRLEPTRSCGCRSNAGSVREGRERSSRISAGWKNTAAAIVHISANAINRPMLEVPGSSDNQRLPNPVAVVIALNITARVNVDRTSAVCPLRHAII